jgi:hypothetical protein
MDISSLPRYQGGPEPHTYPRELGYDRDSIDIAINVALVLTVIIMLAVIFMVPSLYWVYLWALYMWIQQATSHGVQSRFCAFTLRPGGGWRRRLWRRVGGVTNRWRLDHLR